MYEGIIRALYGIFIGHNTVLIDLCFALLIYYQYGYIIVVIEAMVEVKPLFVNFILSTRDLGFLASGPFPSSRKGPP